MAAPSEVLSELKALCSEFGTKLDGIGNCLGDMAATISTLERSLTDIKQDVRDEQCMDKAKSYIAMAEEKLAKSVEALVTKSQLQAVLVRFHKFQDKESVLWSTRQWSITHDGSKFTFIQDLSAVLRSIFSTWGAFVDSNTIHVS